VRGGSTDADIGWFTPAGTTMTDADWRDGLAKSLTVWLNGRAIPSSDHRGDPIVDDDFLVLFNAGDEPEAFTIPADVAGGWVIELDSSQVGEAATVPTVGTTEIFRIDVADRGVIVLRRPRLESPTGVGGG
jgi:glycogen operon protein